MATKVGDRSLYREHCDRTMKFLLFACLLGFAAADFLQQAAPAIDQSVLAFLEGASSAESLSEVLGVDDPELNQLADDAESEIARKVREALKELLEKIKDHVEHGKGVAQDILRKVKELREKIDNLGEEKGEKLKEIMKKITEKAKEILKGIMEKLGLGKRNLDDTMDHVARMKFRELLERIKEKLTSDETIQKIRNYLKELAGKSEIIRKLKELVTHLRDPEIRDILRRIFEGRDIQQSEVLRGEAWETFNDFLKNFKINFKEHHKNLVKWLKKRWNEGLNKLKEKYGEVKAIAMEFIANAKDMSSEMAREALELLRPYKDDLGSLWKQVVDAAKEAIGKF